MTLGISPIRRVAKAAAVGSGMLWWQSSLSACTCDPFYCHDTVGSWHVCAPEDDCDGFDHELCVCDEDGS